MEGVIIGASGLIGSELVKALLADPAFTHVRLLVRKIQPIEHPRLEQLITDFSNMQDFKDKIGNGDVIFCCIGTTMKNVKGNKELYYSIDHDIPIHAANFGYNHGFTQFAMVSSVGAKKGARNFYLHLKGTTEEDLKKFSFQAVHIFRPSMLLGERTEKRTAEKIAQKLMKSVKAFIPSKYKPVEAREVANAMKEAVKRPRSGTHLYHYREIMELQTH
ncbi:MAG: NAD(P)H-binding protein [Flavitalea sp.]